MNKDFEKTAAMGALGACAGVAALYLFMVVGARPTPTSGLPGNGGGIDPLTWTIFAIAALVPTSILIGSHYAFARDLQTGAKPPRG